jgi:hypothetical protein
VIDSFLTLIEFILKKKNYENSTLACEGNSLPPYVVWFHHNLAGFSSSINEFWFVFLCHYPHRDGRHTLLTFVVYVCPFRSYSRFLLWPEIATATGIFFFGGGGLGVVCAHQIGSENAPTCVKALRLRHLACWCDARFDRYDIARENISTAISIRNVTKSLHSTCA